MDAPAFLKMAHEEWKCPVDSQASGIGVSALELAY